MKGKRWITFNDGIVYAFLRMMKIMSSLGLVKVVDEDKKLTHVGLNGFGEVTLVGYTQTKKFDVDGELFVFKDAPNSDFSLFQASPLRAGYGVLAL